MTSELIIRPAYLYDALAISEIHRSNVSNWKIWDTEGNSRPARYAELTPYERWLNGGPWLDKDIYARYLTHTLRTGFVFVIEINERVLAVAELYISNEPRYGNTCNLSTLYVHRNYQGQGLGKALLQHVIEFARDHQCDLFTVANVEALGFYHKYGLRRKERWKRLQVPVNGPSQLTEPLPDGSYDLVYGYNLLIGRYQNAHHDWTRTRPGVTPPFEEWSDLRLERHWLRIGGKRVAIIFEETPLYRGTAECFLFAQTEVIPRRLFLAVSGLAAGLGFQALHCLVPDSVTLPNAVPTGYSQTLMALNL